MKTSVVIPVYNGASTLPRCLQALQESLHQPEELIVVDDGSTDGSAQIAEKFGARVFHTGGRKGPARARNIGAGEACGDVLMFIDADVAVHPGALALMVDRFNQDPDLDAVFGSYDDDPAGKGFISQFKNLMHAFVHRQANEQASTFWCGCGAVKRSVYLEYGGLDENYVRPSIEDIELGLRMAQAGNKLLLDARMQCKHLKEWTFGQLVYTDVVQRGIPWTELILRSGVLPNDLNLKWSQRLSVGMTGLLALIAGASVYELLFKTHQLNYTYASAACVLAPAIALANISFYRFLGVRRGWAFAAAAMPLHLVYYFYSGASFLSGLGLYGWHQIRRMPQTSVMPAKDRENCR